MQIRTKGNKIQLLESFYIPEKKRSSQKIIATFNCWSIDVPGDVIAKLSPEQITELKTWLKTKKETEEDEFRKDLIKRTSHRIHMAVDALDVEEVDSQTLADLSKSIKSLKLAVNRAKRKLTKREESSVKNDSN